MVDAIVDRPATQGPNVHDEDLLDEADEFEDEAIAEFVRRFGIEPV